jgi:ABC-type multidrug transport system fused ATPase/permease subunit
MRRAQEATMFEGTMRNNLDPLGEHSDMEVWEAVEKCRLGDRLREHLSQRDVRNGDGCVGLENGSAAAAAAADTRYQNVDPVPKQSCEQCNTQVL